MFTMMLAAALAAANPAATDPDPPTIVVQGFGSVKTAPNVALFSYTVHGEGKTSDEAVSALVAKGRAIETALKSMDPGLDIHNETVRVQGVLGPACKQDRYDEDQVHLSTGPCAIQGYVATQNYDAKTVLVKDAGTMVGLAGREGATDPKIDNFTLADPRDAKKQAIAQALKDARAKAQAIADANGSRLGDVRSVNLDNAYARGQDIIVTGSREVKANLVAASPVTVVVNPGPVDTTAQVTVAYAIAR